MNVKMLYFDWIDGSEGNDVNNKTSALNECGICHHWRFLNKGFKFQPYVCKRYALLMMFLKLSCIAISKVKNTNYRCVITGISKSKAIKLLHSIDSGEMWKSFWRRKRKMASVSSWTKYESFWGRKAKESWVYEKLSFST